MHTADDTSGEGAEAAVTTTMAAELVPPQTGAQPLFKFDTTKTAWNKKTDNENNYIQVVVEQPDMPHGAVVADKIEPHLLFQMAPALRKHLEGRRIYLPNAECIDQEMVGDIVYDLLRCAREGIPIPEPLILEPIPMIKIHCILTFFEMHKEAADLLKQLWQLFGEVELNGTDVLWIWDTFAGKCSPYCYAAPHAKTYIQMMAWQILNMDSLNKLNPHVRKFIELEREPKYFTEMLCARLREYGLARDLPLPVAKSAPIAKISKAMVSKQGENASEEMDQSKGNKLGYSEQASLCEPPTPADIKVDVGTTLAKLNQKRVGDSMEEPKTKWRYRATRVFSEAVQATQELKEIEDKIEARNAYKPSWSFDNVATAKPQPDSAQATSSMFRNGLVGSAPTCTTQQLNTPSRELQVGISPGLGTGTSVPQSTPNLGVITNAPQPAPNSDVAAGAFQLAPVVTHAHQPTPGFSFRVATQTTPTTPVQDGEMDFAGSATTNTTPFSAGFAGSLNSGANMFTFRSTSNTGAGSSMNGGARRILKPTGSKRRR